MTIIQRELQGGLDITEKIMMDKLPWANLFTKHTFFTTGYKYYISVISSSKGKEAHKIWSGYIESKVRMLVQKLEQHQHIQLAHAFNKGYSRQHVCKTDQEIEQVQEGSLEYITQEIKAEAAVVPNGEGDVASSGNDATDTAAPESKNDNPSDSAPTEVYTTTHYIGLELVPGK